MVQGCPFRIINNPFVQKSIALHLQSIIYLLNREACDDTLYFSCKAHLDDLINSLEEDGKEKKLLSAIRAKYKTILKHMEITEALTEASRGKNSLVCYC